MIIFIWCLEKCPWEKSPRDKSSRENCPPENYPPEKYSPGKLPAGKISPEKLFFYIFVAFDTILKLFLLKLFIVTSFRSVSRTPATSVINLLVTVVKGIN